MMAVLVLLLFCTGGVFAQSASVSGSTVNGSIKELSGNVELKRSGSAAFVPAKAGDTVTRDTIVSTGFKSTALITVGSAVITVKPLTQLSFAEISSQTGTETLDVKLQAGRVRVEVQPPSGTRAAMTVRSPSATASVRGTSFEFDTRNLTVNSGTVAFQGNRGGLMLVSAGSTSRVDNNSKAADPLMTNAEALLPAEVSSGKNHDVIPVHTVDISISVEFM